jgi:FtsH-binding integral membrane protein
MTYHYQPKSNYQTFSVEDMRKIVMEKVMFGLGLAAGISLVMMLLLPEYPILFLLYFVGFGAQIISIIVYFFSRNEQRLEAFYKVFVVSSALVLGGMMHLYAQGPQGYAIIAYAVAITALIFGGFYYYTYNHRPDVSNLGKILFPIGLVFIGMIIYSIIFNPGLIGSLAFAIFGAILFTLYLFYDLGRLMSGQYEMPVRMAWRIYWDVLLIFKYMMRILYLLSNR